MKIIIIGAGIAGLVTAVACQRAGINVKLYDKAKKLQHIGGGIVIWPHGIRYLEWLGLKDILVPYFVNLQNFTLTNSQGNIIYQENYADFFNLIGGAILPLTRTHIQQSLVAALAKNTLTLGKPCVAVHSEDTHATVTFADGTVDQADLVIGADGIHSIIRNAVAKNVTATTTPYCWWGGIVDAKNVAAFHSQEVFVSLGLGKMCIVWPCHGDKLSWYIAAKVPEKNYQPNGAGREKLLSLCSTWNEKVLQLTQAESNTQRFHVPIQELSPPYKWVNKRIVIIGDAAHASGPLLGQGTSQAIEDAYVLLQCYQNYPHDINQVLQHYAEIRHARYARLFELEQISATMMLNDDPLELKILEATVPHINLATMYQDLIPLIDEQACLAVADSSAFDYAITASTKSILA